MRNWKRFKWKEIKEIKRNPDDLIWWTQLRQLPDSERAEWDQCVVITVCQASPSSATEQRPITSSHRLWPWVWRSRTSAMSVSVTKTSSTGGVRTCKTWIRLRLTRSPKEQTLSCRHNVSNPRSVLSADWWRRQQKSARTQLPSVQMAGWHQRAGLHYQSALLTGSAEGSSRLLFCLKVQYVTPRTRLWPACHITTGSQWPAVTPRLDSAPFPQPQPQRKLDLVQRSDA